MNNEDNDTTIMCYTVHNADGTTTSIPKHEMIFPEDLSDEVQERVKTMFRERNLRTTQASLVEVVPGVNVRQDLIDAAVGESSTFDGPNDHHAWKVEQKKHEKEVFDEMKEFIDISKQVVSFDAMSPLLQRVVTAYTASIEANKELESALAALKASTIPVAS